jgi:hypothetical protein
MKRLLFAILIFLFFNACKVSHLATSGRAGDYHSLDANDRALADTLIKHAMEKEGLYTILGKLKPMSTVADLTLDIAQPDSLAKGFNQVTDLSGQDYKKLLQYQRVVAALQSRDLKFIIYPFKINRFGKRNISINIYRQSLVDSMVRANASFYGQFAFSPGTPAEQLVSVTEYEAVYDRFRSYGNLFGYPAHAVDFFVNAAISADLNKKFVKRDFYNIPVYSGESGRFVYALPKDSRPNQQDSLLRKRADYTLKRFKSLRGKFIRADGHPAYYKLFLKLSELGEN